MTDIQDVYNKFEQDEFIEAKADLEQILKQKLGDHLQTKLGLEKNPIDDGGQKEEE